jgi:hypothetical protein
LNLVCVTDRASREITVIVATVGLRCPSVFEADLPPIEYEEATSPDEAHRSIRKALEQGPIAMGPHGPEILSYELVRTTVAITDSAHRPGSASKHRASRPVRCGIGWSPAC